MADYLPDYVASAKPVPVAERVPWYKSTAQTYAGIMLWFVFWETVPSSGATTAGGILAHGLVTALIGVVLAGFICHFASYLAPGLMGMRTGLPLAVVGTSTYGVIGGFLLPGFFMGILQFGWLAVNAYFSSKLLAWCFSGLLAQWVNFPEGGVVHLSIGAVWALVAAFVGLKGIHYVARVATFLPLIPLVILLILLGKTASGIGSFEPSQLGVTSELDVTKLDLILVAIANVVGFFATAGAAGADIASSNRGSTNVQLGGLVGIAGATIFTGCIALLIVAGTYGGGLMEDQAVNLKPTELMDTIMGPKIAMVFWLLLAVAAFPPACFSSLIAAASFKNTLPNINPFISVGIGTAGSIVLVLTGLAADAPTVFGFIGASFGPICGAMTADYLLAGCKWPGPRAGFNLAGWISWAVGFVVGVWPVLSGWLNQVLPEDTQIGFQMPCPPVAAIIVGFVLYVALFKAGLVSRTIEFGPANEQLTD